MVEALCFTQCFVPRLPPIPCLVIPPCPRHATSRSCSTRSADASCVWPCPPLPPLVVTGAVVGVAVGTDGGPDAGQLRRGRRPVRPRQQPMTGRRRRATVRRLAVPRRPRRGVLPLGQAGDPAGQAGRQGPRVHDQRPEPLGGAAGEGQAARRAGRGRDGRDHRRGEATASRRSCYDGQVRWVNDELPLRRRSRSAPRTAAERRRRQPPAGSPPPPVRTARAPSPGLTRSAVRMFRAVCNAFPALSHVRRLRRARRAQLRTGHRLHGQRPGARPGRGRLGARARLRARPVRRPLVAADLDARCAPRRAGARCRTAARPTANHFDHVHISVN